MGREGGKGKGGRGTEEKEVRREGREESEVIKGGQRGRGYPESSCLFPVAQKGINV